MNKYNEILATALAAMALAVFSSQGARAATPAAGAEAPRSLPLRACQSVTTDTPISVTLGKSRVVPLPFPVVRIVVGGRTGGRVGAPMAAASAAQPGAAPQSGPPDGVAETDITLIGPTELYVLGRRPGTMNVVVQSAEGRCLVKDILVTVDSAALQAALGDLLPGERDIRVRATEASLVLTGTVTDVIRMDEVLNIAAGYAGENRKVINLLKLTAPQQVMLEVTIAEVSKTILDRLDLDFTRAVTTADGRVSRIFSGIFGGTAATLGQFTSNASGGLFSNTAGGSTTGASTSLMPQSYSKGATLFGIDAQQRDGIVRVLAEPNIMAISGQSASFLSGGKIFIPVAQTRDAGGSAITLEEKEFGVGLSFTPTVLDGDRINLKFVSEASELQQTGSPFTSFNNVTAILPSMATRRVDTTVQLRDGQSFMVAGLIKNNVTGSLDKFPGLGEAPVVGALFRSTEFQNDQTELMFIVTPRLVRPIDSAVAKPTDSHIAPTRGDVLLRGKGEGLRPPLHLQPAPVLPAPSTAPVAPAAPAAPFVPAVPTPIPPRSELVPVPVPAPVSELGLVPVFESEFTPSAADTPPQAEPIS